MQENGNVNGEILELLKRLLEESGARVLSGESRESRFVLDFDRQRQLSQTEAKALLAQAFARRNPDRESDEILELEGLSGVHAEGCSHMVQRLRAHWFSCRERHRAFAAERDERRRCDHRALGKELRLFVSNERIGKGLVMLLPRGAMLKRILEDWTMDEERRRGYEHVETPVLANLSLFEKSGHWERYRESMFPVIDSGSERLMLRPVSCPHHFVLFDSEPRSWRALPIRYAEIAKLFRWENSGEVSGLTRLRSFTLADSHIFCRPEQAAGEFVRAVNLIVSLMERLGIAHKVGYRASLRSPERPEAYLGEDAVWEKAEAALVGILDGMGLPYEKALGEAAIYGPKLDVQLRLASGKEETAFTVQLDFISGERFGLSYVETDGSRQPPVVVHRSSIGCFERTMAFLIEHFEGRFPCWLAPVQLMLLPVSEAQAEAVKALGARLADAGVRVEMDLRSESLSRRIRDARLQRIPYFAVVGEREVDEGHLSLHIRDADAKREVAFEEMVALVRNDGKTQQGCVDLVKNRA